jgi:hypothetical protein
MANQTLSALSQTFQNGYSTSDVMLLLDVTDTTMASTGTDKGITVANFLAHYGAIAKPLYLPGLPQHTHVNHSTFWPPQVSGVQVNLGTQFLWDSWVAPQSGGYLISDGYGGSHALLWGFITSASNMITY